MLIQFLAAINQEFIIYKVQERVFNYISSFAALTYCIKFNL